MNPIYLDYQATTPLAPEAFEAMLPWLKDQFANPHSAHSAGRAAAAAVEVARGQVMAAMALPGGRLVFTSGATEALNIAIFGAARLARRKDPRRKRVLAFATEHAAVRDSARALEDEGFEPVLLPVARDGLCRLDEIAPLFDEQVALVAAMAVNNEIGVILPVERLAELAAGCGGHFLCDAVQGFGRVPLPKGADMIAISGHKVHGPKGVGALWLRDGLDIPPLIHGGGQEGGLRSGTLSPALCVGFGAAARLLDTRRAEDAAHVEALWQLAMRIFDRWTVNGSLHQRYHGNLNLRMAGLDAARLMSECRGVAFSLGSACASGSGRTSHVLQALRMSQKEARSAVRIGFGRYTTPEELTRAGEAINEAAARQGVSQQEGLHHA